MSFRSSGWASQLVQEAILSAKGQPSASRLIALIVAGTVLVILGTTGQTASAENAVLGRIDEAGTRTIIVTDGDGGGGLDAGTVRRVAALSTAQWAVGLGPATDSRNVAVGPGAMPVPLRFIYGDIAAVQQVIAARLPAGQALVGSAAQSTLGLSRPFGAVMTDDRRELAVVGRFDSASPLDDLDEGLLAGPPEQQKGPVRRIVVLAKTPSDVGRLTAAVAEVLDPIEQQSITIQTPTALSDIRAAVQGELGRYGRGLVLAVLLAGLVLVAVTVNGAVVARRRDLGRRRALGASRMTLVALLVVQAWLLSSAGAAIGALVGLLSVGYVTGVTPPLSFTLATAFLAALSGTVAAVGPALIAAYRDPVAVLRQP